MSYLTSQNMIDRIGSQRLAEVTTREGAVDEIDTDVLAVAIDDAIAEVESYVAGLYDVANAPRTLTVHAAAIAWYRLLGDRAPLIEGAKAGYDMAITFLGKARAGKVSLGDETPDDTARGQSQSAQTAGPAGTFTRDTLTGF